MKTFVVQAVRIAGIALIIAVVYVKVFEHRMIYFPDSEMRGKPWGIFEDVYFEATDKTRLHAWWLPAPETARALIVSHGNAGNISYRAEAGEFLRAELGVNVFMYDYREYGLSNGSPSEAGTYSDIRGAYHHVLSRGFSPQSVFLMGQSLGTAVTVDLAAQLSVAGVILEAPFTSVAAVARRLFWSLPLGQLLSTKYDSLAKISSVHAPVAIIHGTRDPVIHYAFGRELFEAANTPKEFFEVNADVHEGAIQGLGSEAMERLRTFLFR